MKKSKNVRADDVVAEVRAIREQMWKDGGGTMEGYLDLIRRESPARGRATRSGRTQEAVPSGRSRKTDVAARKTGRKSARRSKTRKAIRN